MMHPVTRLSLRGIKEQGASLIMIPGEIPVVFCAGIFGH
jgi:hypothetical protein